MTTMAICVQKQRKDGYWPVYIRVTHNRKIAFIKTSKMVNDNGLNSKKEVRDPYVVRSLSDTIAIYYDRLNRKNTDSWNVKQVVDFLLHGSEDVCFSEYCRKHISRMIENGQERTAKNYKLALQSMELYAGTNRIMFSSITVIFLNAWIKSMEKTHRAKEQYPVCMRQVYRAAMKELNDEDEGIIRINHNPWMKVEIPSADRTEKLAITPEACRAFFSVPLPESKFKEPLAELGRDVAKMILCLGGINTIDLYQLRKADYYDGIIHYKRSKTKKFRTDEAYMEMRVPEIIKPLFKKYAALPDDPMLFCFHQRHSTSDSFGANVNAGIRDVCNVIGIPKEDRYCAYTFRHTWGTVAQNDCGASIAEVAFGMNHAAGHRVTRGYIKLNFEPAWELNERVVDYIFFSEGTSHRLEKADNEPFSRFSPAQMIKGSVFFRGRLLGQIQDIGYNNVDEVISRLIKYIPDDIPTRSICQFKIENLDKHQTQIYEHQKGKGF